MNFSEVLSLTSQSRPFRSPHSQLLLTKRHFHNVRRPLRQCRPSFQYPRRNQERRRPQLTSRRQHLRNQLLPSKRAPSRLILGQESPHLRNRQQRPKRGQGSLRARSSGPILLLGSCTSTFSSHHTHPTERLASKHFELSNQANFSFFPSTRTAKKSSVPAPTKPPASST